MITGLQTTAYIAAAILFIKSIGALSKQDTAKLGNWYGIVGMLIAVMATLIGPNIHGFGYLIGAFALSAGIGILLAYRVEMTQMPQLVAALHSFVGLAAVLVGYASYLHPNNLTGVEHSIHSIEIFIGIFIGSITFTGSILAFGKLQGTISSKPLVFKGRHLLNAVMVLGCLALGTVFVTADSQTGLACLYGMTLIASVLGVLLVAAIGGADMPVVVSMLNSYSGWAAAAAGFMLSNDLLIVTGALVGSSGAILSHIMCEAMNRSFFSVIFGGFGTADSTASSTDSSGGEVISTTTTEVSELLTSAKSVVIVPGYGMAVAKAQYPTNQLVQLLTDRGIKVRFAIHPVAGRLPGHMNVLLAEARVSYDIVLEMDEINVDFKDTDVVLVVGANDIVNPGAEDDPGSPIFGMPVIKVWQAQNVIILKRGMATGYAGVQNPLFFKENSKLLFGDAKSSIDELVATITR